MFIILPLVARNGLTRIWAKDILDKNDRLTRIWAKDILYKNGRLFRNSRSLGDEEVGFLRNDF